MLIAFAGRQKPHKRHSRAMGDAKPLVEGSPDSAAGCEFPMQELPELALDIVFSFLECVRNLRRARNFSGCGVQVEDANGAVPSVQRPRPSVCLAVVHGVEGARGERAGTFPLRVLEPVWGPHRGRLVAVL